jgi:adenine-specific DNA-methyltransferase
MTMIDQPEKLDLTSHNISEDKKQELLRLFPEIRTEGGQIDFDKLKLVLGETVDAGRERYVMTWPGKAECFKTIQAPSIGTLLPVPDESVDFDTTENLIIEGDNLEVLKLLQKAYLGKVKMIYIDPPYNTGNDFIYPDNYTESLQTYLEYTGQVDAEGKKFGTNSDTQGRFHSRWLNMMYPRLYLAQNLLRDDGIIFVSIDDGEFENLRRVLAEIFGEDNYLATFVWKRKAGGGDDSGHVAAEHEYIICFAKNSAETKVGSVLHESPSMTAKYNREEEGRRFYYERLDKTSLTYNKSMDFEIECPDGTFIYPPQPDPQNHTTIWRWSKSTIQDRRDELFFEKEKKTGEWRIYTKTWEPTEGVTPRSLLVEKEHGRNRDGTQELGRILGPKIFENPKPTKLLRHLMEIGAKEQDSLVMDFFAGSGTTAHTILELNKEDTGNRRFILVQLPEPTKRTDYSTITEITKERVRRVIKELNGEEADQLPSINVKQDRGFRVFKLAESNFKLWDAQAPKDGKALEQQLEMHIEHIREGRTSNHILYEILLKSGFPLTTPVEALSLRAQAAKQSPTNEESASPPSGLAVTKVYSVANGSMLICLEKDLTLEAVRAMAEMKPQRVVCLDLGFAGNDQLKTNAVQIFRNKDIVFKTV